MVTQNATNHNTTAHNVILGGASGGITNLAPSATSGVPVISQGSSSDPTFGTVAIAGGGTNATSFGTTHGIVVYDGTSLVNYAGPQISTGGRMTNSSQPLVSAHRSTGTGNVTGDGTAYTIVFDTVDQDNTSAYNNSTGVVTIPTTGVYFMTAVVSYNGVAAGNTNTELDFVVGSNVYRMFTANPTWNIGGFITYNGTLILPITSSTSMSVRTTFIGNATKNVEVAGIQSGFHCTSFGIYMLPG